MRAQVSKPSKISNFWEKSWAILVIVGAGLLIRLWGIKSSLPYLYHWDETSNMLLILRMVREKSFDPHWFHYPSLFLYAHGALQDIAYLVGHALGKYGSRGYFHEPDLSSLGAGKTDAPLQFLLGRLLTTAVGTASIWLGYLSAKRLFGSLGIALLAAALIAASPINIEHSRYITPDIWVVFFALCALWASAGILKQGRVIDYALSGAFVGLCASSKYNGALVACSVVGAHFLAAGLRVRRLPLLFLAGAAALLAFAMTSPFFILDRNLALHDVLQEQAHYSHGHPGLEGNVPVFYLRLLLSEEGGTLLVALPAFVWACVSRNKPALVVSSFLIPYLIFIGRQMVRNDRTILAAIPWLFILAAWGVFELRIWLLDRGQQRYAQAVSLLAALLVAWPLTQALLHTSQFAGQNSRDTARVWIDENLPSHARLAVEGSGPYLDRSRFSVKAYLYLEARSPYWYRSHFDYLIVTDGGSGRFYETPGQYPAKVAQFDELFSKLKLLKRFTEGGYQIRVYATKAG